MITPRITKPPAAVVDANLVVGVCAKESNKYQAATAQLTAYALRGWELFAPGVLTGEVLFALCRKLQDGSLLPSDHAAAISAFASLATSINPPPRGEASLIGRADEIRGRYGCSKSSDSLYLALAEELRKDRQTELVTFDAHMENQAKASAIDDVLKILPMTP